MFDFRQRVFTITALVLLVAGLVIITQQKEFTAVLTAPSQLSAPAVTGYVVADNPPTSPVSWSHAGQFLAYLFILGVLVVGVFQLASFSARLDEKDDARQVVVAYIKQAREQGFSHDQIQKRLRDAGWGDNQLEKSLQRVS